MTIKNIIIGNKKIVATGVLSLALLTALFMSNGPKTVEVQKQAIKENSQVVETLNVQEDDEYLSEKSYVRAHIDEYLVDGLKLEIGTSIVYLKDVHALKAVLEGAQEYLLQPYHNVDVTVNIMGDNIESIDFELVENGSCDSELKSVSILEDVNIYNVSVPKEALLDTGLAIEKITKMKDTPELYNIASGDVPSLIAQSYDMSLSDLYALNPGLEEKATRIQIGDELVVNVPKPDMTLQTEEVLVYTAPIPKGTIKQVSEQYYRGTRKTIKAGSDGKKEIVATVTKVNGVEEDRTIVEEKVIQAPVDALVVVGDKPLPPKGSIGSFVSPLADYDLTSKFGERWNRQHKGIDMAAPTGSSVRASDGGTVTYSGWLGTYGRLVVIDHGNGIKTKYAHNSKLLVAVGDVVSQYQEIAKVGSTGNSTGPHVHFEILFDGTPVNPLLYLEL